MKKQKSKILALVLSVVMISGTVFIPVSAENSGTSDVLCDVQSGESIQWQSDNDDLWGDISDLEYFSNASNLDDYKRLIPQVEQIVISSPEIEEGSVHYENGSLYWKIGDEPNVYDPLIRAEMNGCVTDDLQSVSLPDIKNKIPATSGYNFSDEDIKRSSAFPQEGTVDVCAFLPYSGTNKDNFSSIENVGNKIISYTGGQLLCYKGTNATVDNLAKAIENCAMVMIGSHGNKGVFGITTNEGITNEDKESSHYNYSGTHYKYVGTTKTFDYELWLIDGTIITNHMTKNAPGNLVYLASCMGMKTEHLCIPLRNKNVSVVLGWSESVTSEGDSLFLSIFSDMLCSRKTVAEAFVETKKNLGCEWDPTWVDYTYTQAHESAVAFPIVVSDEDDYPGQGNVNIIQTVNSTWKLPVRSDVPEKQVISLNTQYSDYVVAETRNKITNVSIAAGATPTGMTVDFDDNRVILKGKPTVKGYSVATYKIQTDKNETITKPVGIVTADFSNVTSVYKKIEKTAYNFGKENAGAYLDGSNSKESQYVIYEPLDFTAKSQTLAIIKEKGFLPDSLEYGFLDSVKGSGYIQSSKSRVYSELRDDEYKDYYLATAPGSYSITLDFITRTGEVVRYTVDITVKENTVYTYSNSERTFYINDEVKLDVHDWHAGAVTSVHIIEGSLPPGIILANSWDKPLGFYGSPYKPGDYTVKFRISNYSDYYEYKYTFHIKDAMAKIKGNAKSVGDKIELELGEIPFENYIIKWALSDDKTSWSWIQSDESQAFYIAKPGDAKKYIRGVIAELKSNNTIGRYHFSDIRYVNPLPELSGSVFYTSGIASNMAISTARGGLLNDLVKNNPDKLHYKWQTRKNVYDGWLNIYQADGLTFTPNDSFIGNQIRVEATYDGYTGAVYSTPRIISKRVNNDAPVKPALYAQEPYEKIMIANAKANQEYVVMYSTGFPDWSRATYPQADGEFGISCDKDRTAYVYTRMRETDIYSAGYKTANSAVYNGYTPYLENLTFDKTNVTTKVGEITELTVLPIPDNYEYWDDSCKVSWYVNGSSVELYADKNCTSKLDTSSAISNKTVYMKAVSAVRNVDVGVGKTVGMNDYKNAYCNVEVADEDGNFVLRNLEFEDLKVSAGEISKTTFTTTPQPAKVGAVTFEKTSGPDSELTVLQSGAGSDSVNIIVPDDAIPGTYYYNAKVDGQNTFVISALQITVMPDKYDVVFEAENGTGNKITQSAKAGSEYILPNCPDEFVIPEGFDFAGWDKGPAGSGIVITEPLTLKAQWKPHVHTISYNERVEPSCLHPGMEGHYYCMVCGKQFTDAEGTNEAPTIDYFEIPPKGHSPGDPKIETLTEPDCTNDGLGEEAAYCKECGAEISRVNKVLPAKGHSLIMIPKTNPTCSDNGTKQHYECLICHKFFIEEHGESVEESDIIIPALAHDWGEPEYTWADDNSFVSAKRVCKTDLSHIETEDAPTVQIPNSDYYIYTVNFKNSAFTTEPKKIPKISINSDTETDTQTDSESDSDTETDSQTNSESDSDTQTDSQTNSESDSDTETDSQTDLESDSDTETDSQTDLESDSDTETDSQTNSESDSDTETDTQTDSDSPQPKKKIGDIDGDGEITANDALVALRISVGMETLTPEQIKFADVDGDGNITANDALAILRYSVGMGNDENIGKLILGGI